MRFLAAPDAGCASWQHLAGHDPANGVDYHVVFISNLAHLCEFLDDVATTGAMAAADSSLVFFKRVAELGLIDLKPTFESKGWTSFGDFAYSCSSMQAADPEIFKAEVLVPLLGEDESRVPRVRRLYMQSYAVGAAELNAYANPNAAPALQTMHAVDRQAAHDRISERMVGFKVKDESDPSIALINRFSSFLSTGAVKYVEWFKCNTRTQEINSVDEEPGMKLMPDGSFVQKQQVVADADLRGELRWDLALRRRGVAMDIAGLCSFEAHQLWHEKLRESLLNEPPPGHRPVSYKQLENADRALFVFVAKKCSAGAGVQPPGTKTRFELAWTEGMFADEVRYLLIPLPAGTGLAASSTSISPAPAQSDASKELKKVQNQLRQAQEQLQAAKRRAENQGGRAGGGKGSNKRLRGAASGRGGNNPFAAMEAAGLLTKHKLDGTRFCFAYNLPEGCTHASPGQACPKGAHICARPGCQDKKHPHSAQSAH